MELETLKNPATPEAIPPATPTVDQIVESYCDDQRQEAKTWTNVFEQCVKDGKVTVQTEAQASEIARMINRAEREIEDVKAIADAMIARAQSRLKNLTFLFMAPLAAWASTQLAGKKVRNMLLEGGKLSFRKVPRSVKTFEAEALLQWATANLPDAVEMVPKVKTDVVKAWEEQSGQIAPGRVETPESDSFKVSIPAEK